MTTAVKTVTLEDVRSHVMSLLRAFNEHKVDKVMEHFTQDVVWQDPTLSSPAEGALAARAQVEKMLVAFPDLSFPVKKAQVFVDPEGKTAVATWEMTGTMTGPIDPPGYAPTGKPVVLTGVCRYEFEGGKIRRHEVVYDTMGMLQQLGLMPGVDSLQVKAMAGAQRLTRGVTKTLLHR